MKKGWERDKVQLRIKRGFLVEGVGEVDMDPKGIQIIKKETKTKSNKPIGQGASSRPGLATITPRPAPRTKPQEGGKGGGV